MANRYIDTGFYKSPFIRGLKGSLKGLYSFIICDCTGAGIWSKDLPIACEYIGATVSEKEYEEAFIKTGKAIDLKNGKYFFPDFIEHQYPKGLNENNPAHNNFILELKKYNLIDVNLKVLPSPLKGTTVMVMVKETVIEKVIKTEIPDFLDFENYVISKISIEDFSKIKTDLKLKYEAWVENGWKDGHDKPIKKWKSKILQTVPHLIKDNGSNNLKQKIIPRYNVTEQDYTKKF